MLCRRRHCGAVVVVHCSTPFDVSDALAPMNYCATVRLARLLASSPREPRVAPRRVPPRAVPPRLLASCGQQWCIRTECNSISHLNCYHFSSSYCEFPTISVSESPCRSRSYCRLTSPVSWRRYWGLQFPFIRIFHI